jgi:membrane protein implicated in regulation of membrane protease activity
MPGIITVALIAIVFAIVALTVLSFAVHFLFSPWLLLVAVAVLAWVKFRPRRSHR